MLYCVKWCSPAESSVELLTLLTLVLWKVPAFPGSDLHLTSQFTHNVDNEFIHHCKLLSFIFFSPHRTKWGRLALQITPDESPIRKFKHPGQRSLAAWRCRVPRSRSPCAPPGLTFDSTPAGCSQDTLSLFHGPQGRRCWGHYMEQKLNYSGNLCTFINHSFLIRIITIVYSFPSGGSNLQHKTTLCFPHNKVPSRLHSVFDCSFSFSWWI